MDSQRYHKSINHRRKIGKLYFIKIRNFCVSEDITKKVKKKKSFQMGEVFENHICFMFVFVGLGFEHKALCLESRFSQSRRSTT
jgi:hypothetical protein